MLALAEARAKGLELVARPLKTKVTLCAYSAVVCHQCMCSFYHLQPQCILALL